MMFEDLSIFTNSSINTYAIILYVIATILCTFVGYFISYYLENREIKRLRDELTKTQLASVTEKIEKDMKERNYDVEKQMLILVQQIIENQNLIKNPRKITCIKILGTNSLGFTLVCSKELKKILDYSVEVQFLLVNPNSEGIIKRAEVHIGMGDKPIDKVFHQDRLITEWNAEMYELVYLYNNVNNKHLLKVKARTEEPEFAMLAICGDDDEVCMLYKNVYPKDEGRRDIDEGRGLHGRHFKVSKSKPAEKATYNELIKEFDDMWASSTEFTLSRNISNLLVPVTNSSLFYDKIEC